MFPRSTFPLPLFGADLVGGPKGISAAIVDLSPTRLDRQLPKPYTTALSALPALAFEQPRDLPPWGDTFSEFCVFVRPTTKTDEQAFLDRLQAMLTLHCQQAQVTNPVTSNAAEHAILEAQKRYCLQQQQNDKTRRVLEKAFGVEWATRYPKTMLFDVAT